MKYEKSRIWFCVVMQVKYTVRFGQVGQILSVSASFILGAINKNSTPIEQKFQIQFVQVNKTTIFM